MRGHLGAYEIALAALIGEAHDVVDDAVLELRLRVDGRDDGVELGVGIGIDSEGRLLAGDDPADIRFVDIGENLRRSLPRGS
jgi:hypothetical protein